MVQTIDSQKNSKNQLLIQNAAITTSVTWEQNEQAVNDLTIQEFIQNNLTESGTILLNK